MNERGASIEIITRSSETRFGTGNGGPDGVGDGKSELSLEVEDILSRCATVYFQNNAAGVNIHSKYMLVHAPYVQPDGSYKTQVLVWMGTPNLTGSAINKHWEMMVKLKDKPGAYAAFFSDFYRMVDRDAAILGLSLDQSNGGFRGRRINRTIVPILHTMMG